MRLTWRKEPSERGLARVVQWPRGAILFIDGKRVATVSSTGRSSSKWYWVAGWGFPGVPLFNSCREPSATIDGAKFAAEDYVRSQLGLKRKIRVAKTEVPK